MSSRKCNPSLAQDAKINKSKRKQVQKIKISSLRTKQVELHKKLAIQSVGKKELKTTRSPKTVQGKETAYKKLSRNVSTKTCLKPNNKALNLAENSSCDKLPNLNEMKSVLLSSSGSTEDTIKYEKKPSRSVCKSKFRINSADSEAANVNCEIVSPKSEKNLMIKKPSTLKKCSRIKKQTAVLSGVKKSSILVREKDSNSELLNQENFLTQQSHSNVESTTCNNSPILCFPFGGKGGKLSAFKNRYKTKIVALNSPKNRISAKNKALSRKKMKLNNVKISTEISDGNVNCRNDTNSSNYIENEKNSVPLTDEITQAIKNSSPSKTCSKTKNNQQLCKEENTHFEKKSVASDECDQLSVENDLKQRLDVLKNLIKCSSVRSSEESDSAAAEMTVDDILAKNEHIDSNSVAYSTNLTIYECSPSDLGIVNPNLHDNVENIDSTLSYLNENFQQNLNTLGNPINGLFNFDIYGITDPDMNNYLQNELLYDEPLDSSIEFMPSSYEESEDLKMEPIINFDLKGDNDPYAVPVDMSMLIAAYEHFSEKISVDINNSSTSALGSCVISQENVQFQINSNHDPKAVLCSHNEPFNKETLCSVNNTSSGNETSLNTLEKDSLLAMKETLKTSVNSIPQVNCKETGLNSRSLSLDNFSTEEIACDDNCDTIDEVKIETLKVSSETSKKEVCQLPLPQPKKKKKEIWSYKKRRKVKSFKKLSRPSCIEGNIYEMQKLNHAKDLCKVNCDVQYSCDSNLSTVHLASKSDQHLLLPDSLNINKINNQCTLKQIISKDSNLVETSEDKIKYQQNINVFESLIPENMLTPEMDKDLVDNSNQCSILSEEENNVNSIGIDISGNMPCFNVVFPCEDFNSLTPVSEIQEPPIIVESIGINQLQSEISPKKTRTSRIKMFNQSELQPMLHINNVINSINSNMKETSLESCSESRLDEPINQELSIPIPSDNDFFLNLTEAQAQHSLTDVIFLENQQNKSCLVDKPSELVVSEEKESSFMPRSLETLKCSSEMSDMLTEKQLMEINEQDVAFEGTAQDHDLRSTDQETFRGIDLEEVFRNTVQEEVFENAGQKEVLKGVEQEKRKLESAGLGETFKGTGQKLSVDDDSLLETVGTAGELTANQDGNPKFLHEKTELTKLDEKIGIKDDEALFYNHKVTLSDKENIKVSFRATENETFKLKPLKLKGVNKHIFSRKKILKNKSNFIDYNIQVSVDNMHRKVQFDSKKIEGTEKSKLLETQTVKQNKVSSSYKNQDIDSQLSVEKDLEDTTYSKREKQQQSDTSLLGRKMPAKEKKTLCKATQSLEICSLFDLDLAVEKKLVKPKSQSKIKVLKKKSPCDITKTALHIQNEVSETTSNNMSNESKSPKRGVADKSKKQKPKIVSENDILKYHNKSSDRKTKVTQKTLPKNGNLKYHASSSNKQNQTSEKDQVSPSNKQSSYQNLHSSEENVEAETFNNNHPEQDISNFISDFRNFNNSSQKGHNSVPQCKDSASEIHINNSSISETPFKQANNSQNFHLFDKVDDLVLDFELESEFDAESLRDWPVQDKSISQFKEHFSSGNGNEYSFADNHEINSGFDDSLYPSFSITHSNSEPMTADKTAQKSLMLLDEFKIRQTPKWTRMKDGSSEDSDNDDEHSFKRRKVDQQDEDTSSKHSFSTNSEKSQQNRVSPFKNQTFEKQDARNLKKDAIVSKSQPSLEPCSPSWNNFTESGSNLQMSSVDGGSICEILNLIERKCRKKDLNEALQISRKYIPVSSDDTKLSIIKGLFISTVECIKSHHTYVESEACERTFDTICEIIHQYNLYETDLCSMIIIECIQVDYFSYAENIFSACKKNGILLHSKAVSSFANLLISRESSIRECLNFLEFVKYVCNLPLPIHLLHKSLDLCVKEDTLFHTPVSEELTLLSRILCAINSNEVNCSLLQNFLYRCIDNEHWGKIADLFRAWIKKSELIHCLCQLLVMQIDDCVSYYEKFAAALHGDTDDELPMHHATLFGQIGVVLMCEAFYNGHQKSALEMLFLLHKYKINYFELQAPSYFINNSGLFTQNLVDPLEVFYFPFSVAFIAVEICSHFKRPKDAFDIFRNFHYLTTEGISNPKLKSHVTIRRFIHLVKLAEDLVPIDTLNRGVDCLQHLLSQAEKDFAKEELVHFSKNLGLMYDDCLIRLLNLQQIKIAHEFYKYSNGPLQKILILKPQVLRGLVVSYAESKMIPEAKELFQRGLYTRHVYSIKKPEIDDAFWCLTVVSSWTKHEIKLAIEIYVEMFFPVLLLKHSKSDDESFTIRIKFEEDRTIYYDVDCLEQTSKRIESAINRTRAVLASLDSELTWAEDESETALIFQAETFYNYWKKKMNSDGSVPKFLKLPIISSKKNILQKTSEKLDTIKFPGQKETNVETSSYAERIAAGDILRKDCDDETANSSDTSLSSLSFLNSSISSSNSSPQTKFFVSATVDTNFQSNLNSRNQQVTDKLKAVGISHPLPNDKDDSIMPDDAFQKNVNKDSSCQETSSSLNTKTHFTPVKNCVSLKEPSHFNVKVKQKALEIMSPSMPSKPIEQITICKSNDEYPCHIGNQGTIGARSCFKTGKKALKKLKISRQTNFTSDLASTSSSAFSVVTASEGLLEPTSKSRVVNKISLKSQNTVGFSNFSDEDCSKIIQFLSSKILLKYKELESDELHKKAASLAKTFIQENNVQNKLDKKGMKLLLEFAENNV